MWKVALVVIVIGVAGHFAVRYLRTNPLDPRIEGGEVVVGTNEYEVHFVREGPVEGRYMVASAKSEDWTNQPENVLLSVIDFAEARDYLRAYPDFRRYGSPAGLQLDNVSAPLALVGANRVAYGEIRRLIGLYDERAAERGDRVCIGVSGEALRVVSAYSLDERTDNTATFQKRDEGHRTVLVDRLEVADCSTLAGQSG